MRSLDDEIDTIRKDLENRKKKEQEFESQVEGLGLSRDEFREYKMARFEIKSRTDQVLNGPVILFSGSEEVIGRQMRRAEAEIRKLEERFPALKETYDAIMKTIED